MKVSFFFVILVTMDIRISDHFTYGKTLRFVMPSIAMMIFTSIYTIVDGYFVANYVGKTPFAALNLIYPMIMIISCQSFMFGAGGTALVAKYLGQNRKEKANECFSMVIYVSIITAIILSIVGYFITPGVAIVFGADEKMLPHCIAYGRIILLGLPFFELQTELQNFFVAANKPQLGFKMTAISGFANIVGDFVLVKYLGLGLRGAALATILAQMVGGMLSLLAFVKPKEGNLALGKAVFDGNDLLRTCSNGISELLNNVSMSLVSMLYNWQLIRYAGENGVAAYGAIMYLDFVFYAVFLGYSLGIAPVVSYNYGANDYEELHNIYVKSLVINLFFGVLMRVFAEIMAKPLSMVFTSYDQELMEMTVHGFKIYSLAYLFAGFSVFGSAFFTALNNGKVSAAISFIRALVFETTTVIILPFFYGLDGIWAAIVLARFLSLGLTAYYFHKYKDHYRY